jgi:hypothetical protein
VTDDPAPSDRSVWRPVLLALTVQVLLAVLLAGNPRLYGSIGLGNVLDDVHLYQDYGIRMLSGEVPYRDFRVEYPPLALPFFLLPACLSGPDFSLYWTVFGAEMLLLLSANLFLVAWWVRRTEGAEKVAGRMVQATLLFLPLAQLSVTRFDLAPSFLIFGASLAWASGRHRLSGLLAGLGALVKIVPGVVLAPVLADEAASWRTSRLRGSLVGLGILALGLSAWIASVGGPGLMRESLRYHLDRGLEVGSLGAGAVMAVARELHWPLETENKFSSVQVIAPGGSLVASLAFPTQALAILLVLALFLHRARQAPVRFAGASVLAFVLFGKVLSPQYLLWLYPFALVVEGKLSRMLFFVAACLTLLIYPWSFHRLATANTIGIVLVNLRNVALLALWVLWAIWPVRASANDPFFHRKRIQKGHSVQQTARPDPVAVL